MHEGRRGTVKTHARIGALATLAGVALGVGIPLQNHWALAGTEAVVGPVVWVHPQENALLVHGQGRHHTVAGDVVIHLRAGQQIRLGIGSEPLSALQPGRRVRARVGTDAQHRARWIALVG